MVFPNGVVVNWFFHYLCTLLAIISSIFLFLWSLMYKHGKSFRTITLYNIKLFFLNVSNTGILVQSVAHMHSSLDVFISFHLWCGFSLFCFLMCREEVTLSLLLILLILSVIIYPKIKEVMLLFPSIGYPMLDDDVKYKTNVSCLSQTITLG